MRLRPLRLAVLVLALAAPLAAQPQGLPQHVPGTICYTPQGWCWAVYPGPAGTRCACPANGLWYQGVLV